MKIPGTVSDGTYTIKVEMTSGMSETCVNVIEIETTREALIMTKANGDVVMVPWGRILKAHATRSS